MRIRWVVASVLVVSVAGAACASDAGSGAGSGYETGAGGPTTGVGGATGSMGSSGGRYGYGSGSTGSTGSGGGTTAVADQTVSAVNYRYDPRRITVSVGDVVEVRDTNPQTPHTFTVEGTDIDLAIEPQGSATTTIELDPGTYHVFCRFHGTTQGMTATLVVE